MAKANVLAAVVLLLQILLVIAFAFLTKYDEDTPSETTEKYAYFQDIHIMIFVGFGYLMTFLRKYGFSAVGFNMLIAALAIQMGILAQRLLHSGFEPFAIKFGHIIEGDIAAAAVLISFGAVLGRLEPLQLVIMCVLEILVFAVNFHVGVEMFGASDAGGSIFVHAFGAYFGLAVSAVNFFPEHIDHPKNNSKYESDLFSLIGTIFLWICWPSFNAALVPDVDGQYRAVLHTYLALVACVLTTFGVSSFLDKRFKLDVVHVQNATLAGGVAVGACANFLLQPYGAMVLGMVAGLVSVVGYKFITPALEKAKIVDTCGVNNLHGMPGLLSAAASIVAMLLASEEVYGKHWSTTFGENGPDYAMQAAALGVTIAMALVGGAITGIIVRIPIFGRYADHDLYDDHKWWEVPADIITVHTTRANDEIDVPNTEGQLLVTKTVTTTTKTLEASA